MNHTRSNIVFIVGNSRSGTTMMGRLLGRSDQIFTFNELHYFEQLWGPRKKSGALSKQDTLHLVARLFEIQRDGYLNQGDLRRYLPDAEKLLLTFTGNLLCPNAIFEAFLYYEASLHGKSIPCDQTPRNLFYIKEILENYPQARIINMVRDPRDVLYSQKNKWRRRYLGDNSPRRELMRSWMNYHPVTISKLWDSAVRTGDAYQGEPRLLTIKFEDVATNPDDTVLKICEFLGIPFLKSMLQIPNVGSSVEQDRPGQYGVNRNVISRWKQRKGLTSEELYFCQRITRRQMRRHGYPEEDVDPNYAKVIASLGTFLIKTPLALLLNLHRMKHVTDAVRRRLFVR